MSWIPTHRNPMADDVAPKVNDAFWFDWSGKLVDNAVASYDEAAKRFQELASWALGIYTAATAIGFALSDKSLKIGPTLGIASASVLLIAAYWSAVWVQTPTVVQFDPRSPASIKS